MLKYSSIAAIMGTLAFCSLHASPARAQGVDLPSGDSLDFTPPSDITEEQVKAAPRRDRRRFKAVQSGAYIPMKRRSRKIAATGRGQ